jgi:hypothetical protein
MQMFDLNTIDVRFGKLAGEWTVFLDGTVHCTGYSDRAAARQAAQTLREEIKANMTTLAQAASEYYNELPRAAQKMWA